MIGDKLSLVILGFRQVVLPADALLWEGVGFISLVYCFPVKCLPLLLSHTLYQYDLISYSGVIFYFIVFFLISGKNLHSPEYIFLFEPSHYVNWL